nr:PREDICTED: uncharacterized protein LOC109030525 isoform X1 [Bemisia tabaci]
MNKMLQNLHHHTASPVERTFKKVSIGKNSVLPWSIIAGLRKTEIRSKKRRGGKALRTIDSTAPIISRSPRCERSHPQGHKLGSTTSDQEWGRGVDGEGVQSSTTSKTPARKN